MVVLPHGVKNDGNRVDNVLHEHRLESRSVLLHCALVRTLLWRASSRSYEAVATAEVTSGCCRSGVGSLLDRARKATGGTCRRWNTMQGRDCLRDRAAHQGCLPQQEADRNAHQSADLLPNIR